MTAGIPSDMRRTALVSLVAHVVALVALTTVPLAKPRVEQEAPQAQTEPVSPKPPSSRDLAEALKKAEEALAQPAPAPVTKPLAPTQAPAPPSQTSEEIRKLLDTPPAPVPATPVEPAPVQKVQPPAVARAPQGMAAVVRPAAVERCPPKARAYCPLLEAAINRVWNADTNPAVRQVLESAGDSTAAMRIVIQPNGEIGGIVLYKSSGNDAYDRAVESVLRELQRVPPLPDEMKGEPFVAVTSFTYNKQKECGGPRGTPLFTFHGAAASQPSGDVAGGGRG